MATVTQSHIEAARERVLLNAETFTDELSAACMGRDHVQELTVPLTRAHESTLISGALLAAYRGDTAKCQAAMFELACRHVAANTEYVHILAQRMAQDEELAEVGLPEVIDSSFGEFLAAASAA